MSGISSLSALENCRRRNLRQPSLRSGESAIQINRLQTQGPILGGGAVRLRRLLPGTQHRLMLVGGMKLKPALPCAVRPFLSIDEHAIGRAVLTLYAGGVFVNEFRHDLLLSQMMPAAGERDVPVSAPLLPDQAVPARSSRAPENEDANRL